VVAHSRGADHLHALLVEFLGVELDLVGDDDQAGGLTGERVEAECADAAGDHESDVAVMDAVGLHRRLDGADQVLLAHRDRQTDGASGVEQPPDVRLHLEHSLVVDANPFEHAVAVQQAVIENGDLRIRFIHESVIEPNLQCHIYALTGLLQNGNQAYIIQGNPLRDFLE
jgi:hypothetical protein